MHPLMVAKEAIKHTINDPTLHVQGDMVQFYYTDTTGEEYFEGIVQNFPSKDAMKVGVMPDVEMVPWTYCELFFDSLARQLEPFLAGWYGHAGCLQLYDAGRTARVAYEAPVLYEALDDDELLESIKTALVRVVRAVALLQPVFQNIMTTGVTPTFTESFRAIEREHGLWEVRGFTTSPEDHYAYLPRGLYENRFMRDPTRPN